MTAALAEKPMAKLKQDSVEKIFQDDEMKLGEVDPTWNSETLLKQECIFFLKDIVAPLGLDAAKVKKHTKELERKGKNPWQSMGIGKTWNHWIVRMKVFAPYFRKHLIPKARRIPKDWDGNLLLQQKGTFYLTDVCNYIPFTTHQIRYQAKKNPNSKKEYGVWKDKELQLFLVDMSIFSTWVRTLWDGNYNS
jgi:hypothetical protein